MGEGKQWTPVVHWVWKVGRPEREQIPCIPLKPEAIVQAMREGKRASYDWEDVNCKACLLLKRKLLH